jgi:hypothetical protein
MTSHRRFSPRVIITVAKAIILHALIKVRQSLTNELSEVRGTARILELDRVESHGQVCTEVDGGM